MLIQPHKSLKSPDSVWGYAEIRKMLALSFALLIGSAVQTVAASAQDMPAQTNPCGSDTLGAELRAYIDYWTYRALLDTDQQLVDLYQRMLSDADPRKRASNRHQLARYQVATHSDAEMLHDAEDRLSRYRVASPGETPPPPTPSSFIPPTLAQLHQLARQNRCAAGNTATEHTGDTDTSLLNLDSNWHQFQALQSEQPEFIDLNPTHTAHQNTIRAIPTLERRRQKLFRQHEMLLHAIGLMIRTGAAPVSYTH
jgi:hypothetical protein